MITAVVATLYSLFQGDGALIIVVSILSAFVIFKHRANIKRIANKTEPKIKWL